MRIAITGADGILGRALMTALGTGHDVRALSGDPRDPAAARALMQDRDVLIHLDALRTDAATSSAHDTLDRSARGTYVLFQAAIEHGIRRVLVGSSLALLDAYPPSWAVSEDWRARPDVRDVRHLALYLTEQSARQFVFFEPLHVLCLRFGEIVPDGEQSAARRGRGSIRTMPCRRCKRR